MKLQKMYFKHDKSKFEFIRELRNLSECKNLVKDMNVVYRKDKRKSSN